ncbi:MAG: hypothetical protein RLZ10_2127 [Bacteroidota bacterium]|jgi:hypothetical protein
MSLSKFYRNNKKETIIIGSLIVILVILMWKKPKNNSNNSTEIQPIKSSDTVILVGGLDTRAGDKNINEQVELVRKGLSENADIQGFRYNSLQPILEAIDKKPNAFIICFSAGCQYAGQIAEKLKQKNKNLAKLFIVEPYHSGGTATKSVRKAVELGVPSKNVFVGTYSAAGLGIVDNATPTPKCSPNHWCALTEVAKKL